MKILIASPIRQKKAVLEEFLYFIKKQKNSFENHYFFIDDNDTIESKRVLKKFYKENKKYTILKQGDSFLTEKYICDDFTHRWSDNLIWKVARYKNFIIKYAVENSFDYLFFIDSDLLIHPNTINHLVSLNKDIVSEIFWTKWTLSDKVELPQVWMSDEYNFFNAESKKFTDEEKNLESIKFIEMLKKPGVYKVGGLGACTLISKKALQAGVNFDRIYNLSFWGEDRHFCIRAAALGFELFVDTHYPALHLYRESDLNKIEKFKKECFGNIL